MKPASELAKEIRRLVLNIYDEILSDNGKAVDYDKVESTEAFKRYLLKANELQRADVTQLPKEEKLAFFINIYNALVIHATFFSSPFSCIIFHFTEPFQKKDGLRTSKIGHPKTQLLFQLFLHHRRSHFHSECNRTWCSSRKQTSSWLQKETLL